MHLCAGPECQPQHPQVPQRGEKDPHLSAGEARAQVEELTQSTQQAQSGQTRGRAGREQGFTWLQESTCKHAAASFPQSTQWSKLQGRRNSSKSREAARSPGSGSQAKALASCSRLGAILLGQVTSCWLSPTSRLLLYFNYTQRHGNPKVQGGGNLISTSPLRL